MENIEAIKARQSAAKAEFTDGQYDQAIRDIDTLLALVEKAWQEGCEHGLKFNEGWDDVALADNPYTVKEAAK